MDDLPGADAPLTPEAEQSLSLALHATHPDIDDAMWRILTERATDPSTPAIGTELIDGGLDTFDPPAAPWDASADILERPAEHDWSNREFDPPSIDPADDWDGHPHGFDGSPDSPIGDDTVDIRADWYRDVLDDPDFDDPDCDGPDFDDPGAP